MENIDTTILYKFHQENDKYGAFRLFITTYQKRIYEHIRRIIISHKDTDLILQNVFTECWNRISEYSYPDSLQIGLYQIATEHAIRFLDNKTSGSLNNSKQMNQILSNTLSHDEYINRDSPDFHTQQVLLQLSLQERIIFNMHYYDALSYETIALIQKSDIQTIRTLYRNALSKIENKTDIHITQD